MKKVLNALAPILITGESGAGKSHWANQLARQRSLNGSSIMYVDLAALSDTLFLSELYGHIRGSFTGAQTTKKGLCDHVGKGTLILDEIGELSLENQKHLLSFLDRREYRPLGANFYKKFEGKIIATTNKNLWEMVEQDRFRKDLYYRLHIFHYHLPTLNQLAFVERKKILKNIFVHLKTIYCIDQLPFIGEQGEKSILYSSWPGNIRQMKNFCEYLLIQHSGERVDHKQLELYLQKFRKSGDKILPTWDFQLGRVSYREIREGFEAKYLEEALRFTGGRINQTSMLTGINKTTLISKIRQYGINVLEFKDHLLLKKVA